MANVASWHYRTSDSDDRIALGLLAGMLWPLGAAILVIWAFGALITVPARLYAKGKGRE